MGGESQNYEFLTKTLGSTVSAQVSNQCLQNPNVKVLKAPSTGKQSHTKANDIEIIRKGEH